MASQEETMRYPILSLVLCLVLGSAALAEGSNTLLAIPNGTAWIIPDEEGWRRYASGESIGGTSYALYERTDGIRRAELMVNIIDCDSEVAQCEPAGTTVDGEVFKKRFRKLITAHFFTIIDKMTSDGGVLMAHIEKPGEDPGTKVKGAVAMRFLNDRAGKRHLLIVYGHWPQGRHADFVPQLHDIVRRIREADANRK